MAEPLEKHYLQKVKEAQFHFAHHNGEEVEKTLNFLHQFLKQELDGYDEKKEELRNKVLYQLDVLMGTMDRYESEQAIQRELGVLFYFWQELTEYQRSKQWNITTSK